MQKIDYHPKPLAEIPWEMLGDKPPIGRTALLLLHAERARQLALWGDEAGNSWDRWAVILTEEVGEVCKAIQDEGVDAIRRKAVQVAAVAMAIVEATVRRANPNG